ncbi:MAG: prolyl oligopeptidase family serine peptidase, partial [Flavobacteriaceae bacterium]|nr:prolyl oligopeptidase family serine peptidase [Flavobacteriaceae bacterium]
MMRKLAILFVLLTIISCKKNNSDTSSEKLDKKVTHNREINKYSIDQFYKNKAIGGGSFNNKETKLLVSNNETGIFNVFEINIADGKSIQTTFSKKESFFVIDEVPGSNQFLYTADKGGDENNHIYLVKEKGEVVDLTPGEKVKAGFVKWSNNNKAMFYYSNKRDTKFFDIYKMNTKDWKPKMIYQNNEGLNVDAISSDENLLGMSKSITTSEDKLFLYNRKTKKSTKISKEPGSYSSSGFSKDNQYYFYLTNVGKEFTYLVKYEITTGKKETIFETNWDVANSYLSKNEKYRIVSINEDGKNNLIILDNKTGKKIEFPAIPDGDIKGVSISDSEKLMRLTVGTSKSPNNIYVYNFETKKLKQLTNTLNPELNLDDLVSAEVVRFKSFDGLEIPAIYYKPLTASENNKVPALVFVHGGPGGQSRVGYSSLIQFLVNHGYAILAVNNRGSSGYGKTFNKMDDLNHGDKDLKDCIWGKKWLQDQNY